jgi:hypothetical protein
VTAADLRQIDGLLGSFTTRYNPGDVNGRGTCGWRLAR